MSETAHKDPSAAPSAAAETPKAKAAAALKPDQKAQAQTTRESRSGQKVTVACKVPNGIVIRAFEWNEEDVPVFGGGVKRSRVARPTGDQVVINGPAYPFGQIPPYTIVGGYALTDNVDAELWDLWLEQNAKSALVRNKQIFAYDKPEMAAGAAKEHASVRSGMEGINPGVVKDKDGKERPADPRMPRGTPNITGTTTEARPAA